MLQSNLQYLQRHQVDTAKWDRCIDNAPNGLLYARSFYLDGMAENWDALVLGDYEAVMPLPWRRKFGIRYLYQPAFLQQLGVFSNGAITSALETFFLQAASTRFRFAEIFLNYAHPAKTLPTRTNFVLPLQEPYKQLKTRYKNDLVKNLKRAARFELSYSNEANPKLILEAYKEFYGSRMPHVTANDYARFERLCLSFQKNAVIRAVKNKDQLLSAALLLQYRNRFYLLASVTWPEGREQEANHFLLDRLINEFAASDMILDFEGSDLPGVAHFYRNFGGMDQPYFFYRHNGLPWYIRWMK
jgi:hypothetical protein